MRERAADDQRIEERLDHEPSPERFERDGDIEARAAKAAIGLVEQCADHAESGETLPHVGTETCRGARDCIACIESVLFGDEAVERIRKHAAVFSVLEVHGEPLKDRESSWR